MIIIFTPYFYCLNKRHSLISTSNKISCPWMVIFLNCHVFRIQAKKKHIIYGSSLRTNPCTPNLGKTQSREILPVTCSLNSCFLISEILITIVIKGNHFPEMFLSYILKEFPLFFLEHFTQYNWLINKWIILLFCSKLSEIWCLTQEGISCIQASLGKRCYLAKQLH